MSRDLRHPHDETLLDLAASQLDRPHQLVLEAHLEHCGACRQRVGELAAPGGWWLEQLPSAAPSPALWERLERSVAAPPAADPFAARLPLPLSLRQELAGGSRPRWWSLGLNGGRVAMLLEDAVSKSILCLGEMPGGRRFPPPRTSRLRAGDGACRRLCGRTRRVVRRGLCGLRTGLGARPRHPRRRPLLDALPSRRQSPLRGLARSGAAALRLAGRPLCRGRAAPALLNCPTR